MPVEPLDLDQLSDDTEASRDLIRTTVGESHLHLRATVENAVINANTIDVLIASLIVQDETLVVLKDVLQEIKDLPGPP